MSDAYRLHSHEMKFGFGNPMNATKFFLLMGSPVSVQGMLSLLSEEEHRWDYVAPSSVMLVEVHDTEMVKVSINDERVTFGSGPCRGYMACPIADFVQLMVDGGARLGEDMREACGAGYAQKNDAEFEVVAEADREFVSPMEGLRVILT
jgi:hypothetical protein